MALAALEVYQSAVSAGSVEVRPEVVAVGTDAFDPGDLRLAQSVEESKALNDATGPCIIISASGMATGGRVVHHLERLLPDSRNVIVLPGFQVEGTRGRSLLDGATSLRMFGGDVPVRAEVVGLQEFSAHADSDALVAWLDSAPTKPRTCYVVHGEPRSAEALAARIRTQLHCSVSAPHFNQEVVV
jgi:metallo-beta-lactamase family protein